MASQGVRLLVSLAALVASRFFRLMWRVSASLAQALSAGVELASASQSTDQSAFSAPVK